MKKILLPILIIAIVLGMSNCQNEPEDEKKPDYIAEAIEKYGNPFIGTWEAIEEDSITGIRLVFTDNTNGEEYYLLHSRWDFNKHVFTYTYDDTKLIITHPESSISHNVVEYPYDFKKNKSFGTLEYGWIFKKVSLKTDYSLD